MFLLGLLRVGSYIKDFFLLNWKWLVPLIAIIIAFFVVSNHYYDKGVVEERASWEKRIESEDIRNRKFESKINDAITKFGTKVKKEAETRVTKETIYKNKIETIVKENLVYTQCLVDQEILDSRNAIRAQGPK
jgi:predicted negative regulator of RcsB-dependent stress response